MNKHTIAGLGVILLVGGSIFGYYEYSERYPSTDNAYVNANLINVAPKVGGYIQKIYVTDNQFVHKGDPLVDIDPQDYNVALTKAKQDLALANQQAATAKAAIVKAQSDYKLASELATRYTALYKENAGSLQDMQKYQNQADAAKQSLDQATSQYQASQAQVGIATTGVTNAQNNNGYTQLSAPADGYISNLYLQNGELVSSGQKLFGLVDNANWWIDVNFKETQLKRIKVGQPAEIELDMYNHKYKGVVQSISYASGSTFSLLPAQNATGNWVKVTQRFTVRVKVENSVEYPLRVGASSKVTVDTTK